MGYIYCITNLINQKQYVGKTTYSITKRFKEHCKDHTKEKLEKRPLYRAMRKYGIENFIVQQLIECDNEELDSYEILYIDKLDTYHNGYNATRGGDGKPLFDYKQIIETYQQGGTLIETASKIGCCVDTVRDVLYSYNIPIRAHNRNEAYEQGLKSCINPKRKVIQLNLNHEELQRFESIADAAHWLVDNKYTKKYSGGVRQKICNCCKDYPQHKAYGFKWKYLE